MESDSDVYGPFRSERTYELKGFDEGDLRDIDEIAGETNGFVDEDTYDDLVEIYGEEELTGIETGYRLEVSDGVGCTEIWEKMSEERESY